MSSKTDFLLLILTVTMVTKSVAQTCPDTSDVFGPLFTDCGPDEFPEDYAMCCLRGDPHIWTFDGYHYDFGAEGYYKAVYPCGGTDGLVIVVYIAPRKVRGKENQFRIVGVKVIKDDKTYKVTFKKNTVKDFTVKDGDNPETSPNLPYNDEHFLALINTGKAHEIIFRCEEVKIRINCKFHTVYIWIKKDLDNVCGLCGYYNGIKEDDVNCIQNCNDDEDKLDNDCSNNDEDCDPEDLGKIWLWAEHDSSPSTSVSQGN